MKSAFVLYLSLVVSALATTRIDQIRNDRVIAYFEILHPAENESGSEGLPSITVFMSEGLVQYTADNGKRATKRVKPGEVMFREKDGGRLYAAGNDEIHFMRIEFRGSPSTVAWGTTGFGPDSRMLLENGFARTYDIRIPAGKDEPQHTHHDRVVVCLSGATLRHLLPDGREEDSTIRTGQCLWRKGQTHIGRNIGKTDLWVIAIEPK